jgi:hypothetical protein
MRKAYCIFYVFYLQTTSVCFWTKFEWLDVCLCCPVSGVSCVSIVPAFPVPLRVDDIRRRMPIFLRPKVTFTEGTNDKPLLSFSSRPSLFPRSGFLFCARKERCVILWAWACRCDKPPHTSSNPSFSGLCSACPILV